MARDPAQLTSTSEPDAMRLVTAYSDTTWCNFRHHQWAAQMERLLAREREAVWAELMGLRLQYSTLQRSVEMLHNYQEDMTRALEWQEENNVQEDDLLLLCDPSLPSNDN
ncbi:hypothetical protein C0993_008605 [Termitomyces sp. T159_Od127]|nr:hypothetical protein C0993_008605 [Termitomyces sp. T159_Od127]